MKFNDTQLTTAAAQCHQKGLRLLHADGPTTVLGEKVGIYTQCQLNLAVNLIRMSLGWLPVHLKGLANEFLEDIAISEVQLPEKAEIAEPPARLVEPEGDEH